MKVASAVARGARRCGGSDGSVSAIAHIDSIEKCGFDTNDDRCRGRTRTEFAQSYVEVQLETAIEIKLKINTIHGKAT